MHKILFFLIYFLGTNVFAYWEFLHSTNNANVYYFKKDNYKGFLGGTHFATLIDLKSPQLIAGEPYMSVYSKFELDCSKRKFRVLTIEYYSKNKKEGRIVSELTEKSDWLGATESDLNMYCKK